MIGVSITPANGSGGDRTIATDKDAALTLVSNDVAMEIDPTVEKRVLRKIDLFFMPAMLVGQLPE
jgi:hypothetical protein